MGTDPKAAVFVGATPIWSIGTIGEYIFSPFKTTQIFLFYKAHSSLICWVDSLTLIHNVAHGLCCNNSLWSSKMIRKERRICGIYYFVIISLLNFSFLKLRSHPPRQHTFSLPVKTIKRLNMYAMFYVLCSKHLCSLKFLQPFWGFTYKTSSHQWLRFGSDESFSVMEVQTIRKLVMVEKLKITLNFSVEIVRHLVFHKLD